MKPEFYKYRMFINTLRVVCVSAIWFCLVFLMMSLNRSFSRVEWLYSMQHL